MAEVAWLRPKVDRRPLIPALPLPRQVHSMVLVDKAWNQLAQHSLDDSPRQLSLRTRPQRT
jgi:hypothetical protein